jgi:hypothetical protein
MPGRRGSAAGRSGSTTRTIRWAGSSMRGQAGSAPPMMSAGDHHPGGHGDRRVQWRRRNNPGPVERPQRRGGRPGNVFVVDQSTIRCAGSVRRPDHHRGRHGVGFQRRRRTRNPGSAQLCLPRWRGGGGRPGAVHIADRGNERIRKVGPDGIITTVAGTGVAGFSGDGARSPPRSSTPPSTAVGRGGSLIITDWGNLRIRQASPDGIVTTVAGTGVRASAATGGQPPRPNSILPRTRRSMARATCSSQISTTTGSAR